MVNGDGGHRTSPSLLLRGIHGAPKRARIGAIGVEFQHEFQNCFASSAACLFPSSIVSSARPSPGCSTVIAVILCTPIKWSQNSMYLVTYSKPGGGTV